MVKKEEKNSSNLAGKKGLSETFETSGVRDKNGLTIAGEAARGESLSSDFHRRDRANGEGFTVVKEVASCERLPKDFDISELLDNKDETAMETDLGAGPDKPPKS
jgi:hypothetical protein